MSSGFTHESTLNESKEWYTPKWIFDLLKLQFDLDPCAPPNGPLWVPATSYYALPEHDGLRDPWEGRVFMNPPYGADTPLWMEKFTRHPDGIALVFARTDTNWFHDYATLCEGRLFLRGRIRFYKPDGTMGGSPGSGSMLLAQGSECAAALKTMAYGGFGWYA